MRFWVCAFVWLIAHQKTFGVLFLKGIEQKFKYSNILLNEIQVSFKIN